ncbi:hypothetical protein [Kangiella sediminilitoris]|uniref:Lipoprotein n=1 Tax=Kangiella sediminilitoris TaxID=1144748 RepID=A0A1B3BCA5_9GAMM|nr:hypothetical protein [Kangiella sediminilitoris]AOE50440.1 hypothetical protein KS2013_1731 [Kangiella sediminilitoris]
MRIIILSLLLAGCLSACNTSRPLTNLNDHNIEYLVGQNKTLDDVRVSILQAGQVLGWEMQQVKPNLIRGTLVLRAHTAVVDIPYNLESYSILYVDSVNLDYDGTNIHRSYPRWVNNLKAKIDEFIVTK